MDDSIAVKTDLFEHRVVKPNFINPCCFGEDFALWLKQSLSRAAGTRLIVSEPIQEDYGWGLWAAVSKDRFWIALSYVVDGPQEGPAEWVISVSKPGLISKLLRWAGAQREREELRGLIGNLLKSEQGIQIVELARSPG